MPNQIEFVTAQNKDDRKAKVLAWLEADFERHESPDGHFWHNRRIISQAFDKETAMAVFNDDNEVIGYMIWSIWSEDPIELEIDIVEVDESYRRQGISKAMIAALTQHFPTVAVLTASVIDQSVDVFSAMGWQKIENPYRRYGELTKFHRTVKTGLTHTSELPDGHVIAVFSQVDVDPSEYVDFYRVQGKPEKYQKKYFKITLDADGNLLEPIIVPFEYEGYVGIYSDKKLIAEGKTKNLFRNSTTLSSHDLFVLDKIKPCEPEKFVGFFPTPSADAEDDSEATADTQEILRDDASAAATAAVPNTEDHPRPHRDAGDVKPVKKRARTGSTPDASETTGTSSPSSSAALFAPARSVTLDALLASAQKQIPEPDRVQLIFQSESAATAMRGELHSTNKAEPAGEFEVETITLVGEGGAAGRAAYAITLTKEKYNEVMGEENAYDDLLSSFTAAAST